MANSELFYTRRVTQNKQAATSKDTMKGFQLEKKFCYLKNKSFYSDKKKKNNFSLFLFFKKPRN